MPTHTAYIYFGIQGDFDPYEFANRIKLSPDECVAKRANNPDHQIPKASLLRYAQVETFSDLIDIYELAERSIDILEPHLDSLISAIRDYDADPIFQVVLYYPVSEDISTPAFGFSKRVVSIIASTGASIDIDTYRL
ncbi:DUF4279 domain-containing protein [Luteolibacter pohnpeiensis]|uniref:DUF4279 domain-containing protein n=1 Tax=Luteolibacter pohnpeiensis TaxID=454153 RepID=A0A934VVD4_9BACT|nr:DUF4279 domain-containing protein [Luteolibacter pohnpeiensis]MBK1883447.1 DUF4279 domain-containing protein [Luteolibacter pohnpeiensis]